MNSERVKSLEKNQKTSLIPSHTVADANRSSSLHRRLAFLPRRPLQDPVLRSPSGNHSLYRSSSFFTYNRCMQTTLAINGREANRPQTARVREMFLASTIDMATSAKLDYNLRELVHVHP
jgi:hypothetical protein